MDPASLAASLSLTPPLNLTKQSEGRGYISSAGKLSECIIAMPIPHPPEPSALISPLSPGSQASPLGRDRKSIFCRIWATHKEWPTHPDIRSSPTKWSRWLSPPGRLTVNKPTTFSELPVSWLVSHHDTWACWQGFLDSRRETLTWKISVSKANKKAIGRNQGEEITKQTSKTCH